MCIWKERGKREKRNGRGGGKGERERVFNELAHVIAGLQAGDP